MSLIYIEQLLKTCEEMLFSIALPEEVVSKYEQIRQEYLFRAGVTWPSRIRFLQQDAYLKAKTQPSQNAQESILKQTKNQLEVSLTSFQSILSKINYILSKKGKTQNNDIIMIEDNERYLLEYINKFQKLERSIYQSLDILQDQFTQIEKESKNLKQDIMQQKQNFNLNQHGVQKELEIKENKIKELSENLKETQMQKIKAQEDLAQFRSENLQNLQMLQNELNNLQYQISMLENERQELTTCNFSLEKDLKLLQQEREDLEQQCSEQNKYLSQSQKIEQQLKQELDNIKKKQQEMIDEVQKQHEIEISKLKKSFTVEYDKQKRNLQDSSELEHLRTLLRQTRKENTELKEQLDQVNNKHDGELQKIQQSLEPLSQIWDKFKTTDLEKEIEKLKKELDDLPGQLAESLAQSQFLALQADKLSVDNQWLVDRLTEFGRENEMLRSQFQNKREEHYEEELEEDYEEQQKQQVAAQKKQQLSAQQKQKIPSKNQQSQNQTPYIQQEQVDSPLSINKNSPSFGVDLRKQVNEQIQHSKQVAREWEEARDELLRQLEDREDVTDKFKSSQDSQSSYYK